MQKNNKNNRKWMLDNIFVYYYNLILLTKNWFNVFIVVVKIL